MIGFAKGWELIGAVFRIETKERRNLDSLPFLEFRLRMEHMVLRGFIDQKAVETFQAMGRIRNVL